MDNPAKLEFEIWLQYKGSLASYIQTANKLDSLDKLAKEATLLRVFAYHLHALGLDHAVPESREIVWGSGQIRAYWKFNKNSLRCAHMLSCIGVACNVVSTQCPITSISSITFKEPNTRGQTIRVKGYSITAHDIPFTSPPPEPPSRAPEPIASSESSTKSLNTPFNTPFPPTLIMPIARSSSSVNLAVSKVTPATPSSSLVDPTTDKVVLGPAGTETTSQADQQAAPRNTNKRKLEDESITHSSERPAKRSKRSKRRDTTIAALPPDTSSETSPKISSDAPKFIVPPPLLTPSDNHLSPHNQFPTIYGTSYESYTLPSKSFQGYRVDMSGVCKTLLMSIQRHLGKARTQLAEVKGELLEERKERQRLEEELEDRTELVPEVSQPVVLPLSPPHSPTSEGIDDSLIDAGLMIPREVPIVHDLEEGETDEDPPLEKLGRHTPSDREESMAAQIQQLEELLRQQRAAWEATEQERIALQNLLINERQRHMQAEKESDPLRGIASATVPAFVEALDKLAQLTDKIAV